MTDFTSSSIPERLSKDTYDVDETASHISINQELARLTDFGKVLEKICPAHVYTVENDGHVSIQYAACLECGTCLAMSPPGVLTWHYPDGGKGIVFREG